jgi:hypothetical protein
VSVKVIAELNPFSTRRTALTANAQPIAGIVRELNTAFALSQARVSRNGEIVTDFSEMARDGDILWIKFVPAGTQMAGAGMKAGGWALAFIGLVVGVTLGWTGIGGALGVALIGAGVSLATGGTVLLNVNLNIPSLKDSEKPDVDPSIRGARNQMRPHGRIPVLFGRHRIYPDLAAKPYTEIINGKQYYTQLFCGGYKDCVIDPASMKLGETPLVDLSQTKNITSILAGADTHIRVEILQNGEASGIYPHCVHENMVSAALKNKDDDGNPIDITRTTPDKTDTINVDILLPNGIGKYNDDGSLGSASVEVRASYKKLTDPDSSYQLLGYFNSGSNTISGAELKTKRYQITKSVPAGQYTVKVERVTADSDGSSRTIDQVYVGSIRSKKSTRPIRLERQRELTIVALRVMATEKMSGVVESFNYVATAKLPVYSGPGTGANYWLTTAETRNPASALLYALRGRAAQQFVDAADIDWPALEAFYTWCADHEYTCNAYCSEAVTVAELLRMIGGTARADILRIDSKISVVQDIERNSHAQLFTPKNTKSYSVTMLSADVPDAISLHFIDEAAGFAENDCLVYNTPDGNRAAEPETTQRENLWGITDDAQARRIGMYTYACLKNRPFVHTIEVDIEYLLCSKGDWIQYAGDIALAGTTQGRVVSPIMADGLCVGIRTDEPIEMNSVTQYAVRIRKSDGTVVLKEIVFLPGTPKEYPRYPVNGPALFDPGLGDPVLVDTSVTEPRHDVYFTEPFPASEAPVSGDLYAFGIRGREVLDLIITDIQPQADLSATLVCVEYSPEIFGVDSPGFVLPEFKNKITPFSGAVDSGTITPEQWKLFVAYHDNEAEPPRPTGDGLGGGWHYAQTLYSVWQSSKMAESVTAGAWGPPVRIRNERGNTDVTPLYLTLSPQNKNFECDGDENILAGLLPFTSQARLFKWNTQITGDIAWSLQNAPAGVTVNQSGLVTVSGGASLSYENNITVRAEYQGTTYTAVLSFTRDRGVSAPRYLGTINTLPSNAQVTIVSGPAVGLVTARQGDYVLAVTSGATWQAGRVYQWTGIAWEYRAPDKYTDLYLRCFKDGLAVPGLTQDMGWFGAVFSRLIIAQQAFIETLEAQLLKITGAIYGGDRYDSAGNVIDQSKAGWFLGADGVLKAMQGIFEKITLTATSFEITVGNKGYLPVGFIYFQLKGQPAPGELFTGTWENISSQFAGLFFRVEGGNAAAFGSNSQNMSIQTHSHSYSRHSSLVSIYNGNEYKGNYKINDFESGTTGPTGDTETRPVNTTIRVWKRTS